MRDLLCLIGIHRWISACWLSKNPNDRGQICSRCYKERKPWSWPSFWHGFMSVWASPYTVAAFAIVFIVSVTMGIMG